MGQVETKQEGQIQDSRYGKALLVNKQNQSCALRKVIIQDESQHESFLKRAKVDHPNLVKILESGIIKEKELCTTFHVMFVVSEYYPTSLHKEIANRRMKGLFWSEQELWNQVLGLVDLLATMQEAHIVHQNIRPLTISYANQNTLKLCDNYFQQSAFQMAFSNPENQKLFELSPKLLEAVNQNNQFPRHNLYKSDVWSLGMCMLEASILDHCRDCFDFESGHAEVSRKLAELKSNYSNKYEQLIISMLNIDEDSRPDFRQLRGIMKGTEIKSLESSMAKSMCADTKPPQPLIEDNPDTVQIQADQIESQISKPMIEMDSLRGKPKLIVKKPKKKELGIYKYQDQMIIKDTSKSQMQQQKLTSYPSVDYSFNKQFANSSLQFTNSSQKVNTDREKVDQLLGKDLKSYSIGPTITPISYNTQSIKYTSSITSQPKPQFQSNTTQATNIHNVITIDPHPSCTSIPLSFTEIPLTLTIQKDNKFKEEMQQMIEMNQSRVFKNETYPDGSSYMGETSKGMRDGFGRYQYADGGYYEGQWKQNKMHGYGTLFYGVGKKAYEGQFENDQFSGFGTLYNKDPSKMNQSFDYTNFDLIGNCWIKYVGNFKNDLKDGQGVLHLSNGENYRGEFREDYVHGHGQFNEIVGMWRQNRLVNNI